MEKIIEKLEGMLQKYLEEIETKPVKTLFITMIIYYIFKTLQKKRCP